MKKYGYIRVFTAEQCTDRQIIGMAELNIPPENIFTDKLSGKNTARPALQKLMATVRQT
ncbi:MAG: recombinase family protein [Oscillospiraceae bacterium]|jgi:DNA invertase Pin-like site-specific DNA recombinase|nr:recombinase family protein [Oscillospiraceae bacterium]